MFSCCFCFILFVIFRIWIVIWCILHILIFFGFIQGHYCSCKWISLADNVIPFFLNAKESFFFFFHLYVTSIKVNEKNICMWFVLWFTALQILHTNFKVSNKITVEYDNESSQNGVFKNGWVTLWVIIP